MNKIIEFLLEIDRIVNWFFLGDRRETISARMGRNMHKDAWAYYGCKLLEILMLDKNHCQEAKQNYENIKSNDHPLIFAFFTIGIAVILWYLVSHFVN